jgi:hypothetical protein
MPSSRLASSALIAGLLLAAVSMTSCSSAPTPRDWSESRWPDLTVAEVARTMRAVLQQKFGYSAMNWKEFPAEGLITFETDWNTKDAHGAVLSRTGIRRKAWVEIQRSHRNDDAAPPLTDEQMKAAAAKAAKSGQRRREPIYEDVKGRRMRVVAELAIAVEAERNNSTIYAGVPEKGDWQSAGSDSEEIERLLSEIKFRLNELSGNGFDASPEGKAAHEKYFKKEYPVPGEPIPPSSSDPKPRS